MWAKSGVRYTVKIQPGKDSNTIDTDTLQHPIKVVVPANNTSNGTSDSSADRLTLRGLMNNTGM